VANPAQDRLYEMLQDREVHHIPVYNASESVNAEIQLTLHKVIQLVRKICTEMLQKRKNRVNLAVAFPVLLSGVKQIFRM